MYTEERLIEKTGVESGIDIDWYLLDSSGRIAIVASAGGLLPDQITSNMDRLRRTISHFRSLPVLSNDILIEQHVLDKVENYTPAQREAYLSDIYFMVSRGFYYFDKIELNSYFDFRYHLMATPKIPFIINRSSNNTQNILPDIILDGDLGNIKLLLVNELA